MIHRLRKCCLEIPELNYVKSNTDGIKGFWQIACNKCGKHTTADTKDEVVDLWNKGVVYLVSPANEELKR